MSCKDKDKFITSEAATKSAMRTAKAIDKFLNIKDLPKFRRLNKEWSDYAKDTYGSNEMLFFEQNGGKKALPNTKIFQSIDKKKNINYPENANANLADAQQRGKPDLKIQKKYFKSGNVTTDTQVLKDISNSNHPLRDVAKSLIKYANGTSINLIDTEGLEMFNSTKKATGIAYTTGNSKDSHIDIAKNASFKELGVEPTIIHEILHTFTSNFINNPENKNSQTLKDFTKLYEHAKNSLRNKNFNKYALTNLDEFIVGLFTDAAFIKEMESLPAINTTKYKNLLEEIFDSILKLFNFKKNTTLYSQAFDVATNIIEAQSISDNIYDMTFEENNEQIQEFYNKVNEFDNKTELNNEDYVAYEKTVRDLSEKLAHRIGATVKFENDKTLDYQSKIVDDVVYVNLASATITTPVHSILSVPIVKAIKEENYELYKNLLKTLQEPKGIEILNRLNGENENDFQDNQELAIAELLSLYTTDKLNKYKDRNVIGLFKSLFKSISNFVKGLLKAKQLEIAKLPENMTINDLANLFAYSKSNLILPGYQATYTTPDNKKFKTYEEANNHITNLIKQYESYNQEEIDEILNNTEASSTREASLIYEFIDNNNQFEQSKIILEEFKRVNNIVYNPQEVYSRGHEFISVMGAYTSFDVNLMMQNLLEHISDNKKAGTKFTISAFTRPVNTRDVNLEELGGKIRYKIQPKPEDIEWAVNANAYSGSSIGVAESIDPNMDSEILGVSYTKTPTLLLLKNIQPNLAGVIDNVFDRHNELGITLTGENFRLEYDEDIPYETKQILNSINAILDQRYGKFEKEVVPEVSNKRFELQKELSLIDNVLKKRKIGVIAELLTEFTSDELKEKVRVIKETIEAMPEQGVAPANNNLIASISEITNKVRSDIKEKEKTEEVVFTEKATNNLKIAALKQFAKKYPRILITSKVEKIDNKNIDNSNVIEENMPKLPEIRKCN